MHGIDAWSYLRSSQEHLIGTWGSPLAVRAQDWGAWDMPMMRHFLCKRYAHHRGVAAGLVLILLAVAFGSPVMVPGMCASSQQSCQSLADWLLVSVPLLAVATVAVWFLWTTDFTLLREHPLLLFKPPRPEPR
jgi:hypothetical protein